MMLRTAAWYEEQALSLLDSNNLKEAHVMAMLAVAAATLEAARAEIAESTL